MALKEEQIILLAQYDLILPLIKKMVCMLVFCQLKRSKFSFCKVGLVVKFTIGNQFLPEK